MKDRSSSGPLETTAEVNCPAEEVTFIAAPFTSSTAATSSFSVDSSDVLMLSPLNAEDKLVLLLLVMIDVDEQHNELTVLIVEYGCILLDFFPWDLYVNLLPEYT